MRLVKTVFMFLLVSLFFFYFKKFVVEQVYLSFVFFSRNIERWNIKTNEILKWNIFEKKKKKNPSKIN